MGFLKDFRYHSPVSLTEALGILETSPQALLLGGGTFVVNSLKKVARCPSDIVGLKKIPELSDMKPSKDGLSIGAMTTIGELLESAFIQKQFPSLVQAASQIGTTPIRHMATIGGNVSSRFFWVDLPAVLISLDAKLILATSRGEKILGVDEFLASKPAERFIVKNILLPKKDLAACYFRHTRTMEVDLPSFALAFSAQAGDSRLKHVRLVVNTGLSFPVEFKNTAASWESQPSDKISMEKTRESLSNDLALTKLDEYQRRCLIADIANLAAKLEKHAL